MAEELSWVTLTKDAEALLAENEPKRSAFWRQEETLKQLAIADLQEL